jgi:hypothetical protein
MNIKLPDWFAQTSEGAYDRHNYRLHFTTKETIIVESYEEVYEKWFNTPSILKSHVEVLDKKTNKKRKKSTGGFK